MAAQALGDGMALEIYLTVRDGMEKIIDVGEFLTLKQDFPKLGIRTGDMVLAIDGQVMGTKSKREWILFLAKKEKAIVQLLVFKKGSGNIPKEVLDGKVITLKYFTRVVPKYVFSLDSYTKMEDWILYQMCGTKLFWII